MKCIETHNYLGENVPYLILFEEFAFLLFLLYSHVEISSISIFHDDAKSSWIFFNECLLVLYDVWTPSDE